MCKATVIFEEKLGKRREGWAVYLNQSRDFTWYSDKQVKAKIAAGERINGVTVTEGGEVVMDETFTTGLLAKTGLGYVHAYQGGRGQRRIEVFRSHPSYQGRQGWRPL